MNVMLELAALIRDVFDAPDAQIGPATTANEVDGWDSLSHVNLIVAVESRFKIRFTSGEVLAFRNVGDLATAVEKKLAHP